MCNGTYFTIETISNYQHWSQNRTISRPMLNYIATGALHWFWKVSLKERIRSHWKGTFSVWVSSKVLGANCIQWFKVFKIHLLSQRQGQAPGLTPPSRSTTSTPPYRTNKDMLLPNTPIYCKTKNQWSPWYSFHFQIKDLLRQVTIFIATSGISLSYNPFLSR